MVGAVATAGVAALWLVGRSPWRVERWYVEGVGPAVQGFLVSISRPLPFSLIEGLVVLGSLIALAWLGRLGLHVRRQPGRRGAILGRALVTAWAAVATIGLWFYGAWGLSYARPPAAERLGWANAERPLRDIDTAELIVLGNALVDRVNRVYLQIHGWPDAYAVTTPPPDLDLDAAVDDGWARMADAENLPVSAAASRGRAKPLQSSLLFTFLGIAGVYSPFTAEANFDAMAPLFQRPFTIAHEKSHQRFVASENEANFFGFLACIRSEQPFVNYDGWLFAQRQILSALQDIDPYGFYNVIERRYPGVQRDVNHVHAFWEGYKGPVSSLGLAMNDRYLRFNGVSSGVYSYNESLVLVVEWLRRHPEEWREITP